MDNGWNCAQDVLRQMDELIDLQEQDRTNMEDGLGGELLDTYRWYMDLEIRTMQMIWEKLVTAVY